MRLKGNLSIDLGFGEIITTGELAAGQTERYLPQVRLFHQGVPTNLAIWQEGNHPEPWIIAMKDPANRATVAMYGCVHVGQEEARNHPTPWKKTHAQTDLEH